MHTGYFAGTEETSSKTCKVAIWKMVKIFENNKSAGRLTTGFYRYGGLWLSCPVADPVSDR